MDFSNQFIVTDFDSCTITATVRPQNALLKQQLRDFGQYVADCLPKYVQEVAVTYTGELEIMIHPEGVLPVLSFLKDHHNAQFLSIADIAGMDVPTREYRFEVSFLKAVVRVKSFLKQ